MFGPFAAKKDPHFSCSFRRPSRRSLWARLHLYEDALRLWELTWAGWRQRTIRLSQLRSVQWWTGKGDVNLALHLRREIIEMKVKPAGLLKFEIEARADNLEPSKAGRKSKIQAVQSRVA